jgi:hypothetical protein
MKEYIAQRSKAFAAGLAGAITTALIKLAEQSFGFDIEDSLEVVLVSSVAGFINGLVVYWAPANKPMEPKP